MSSLAHAILVALATLPAPYGEGEQPDEREARLGRVAAAIEDASTDPDWPGTRLELAAALVTKAWWESGLALRVHRAGPRKDNGGHAISLWSLHSWKLVPYAEWKTLGGLEGTERSADVAARVLSFARNRCGAARKDWVFATFSLYATGRTCSWKGARSRVWTYRRVLEQIEGLS